MRRRVTGRLPAKIVLERQAARQDAIAPVPRLRVRKDGQSPPILIEHPEPLTGLALLKEALGTVDDYFADGLLDQVINVNSPYGAPIESKLNFMLAVIAGIKQDDQPLAMLASQMALVQMAIMELGSRLANAVAPSAKESILREINRAARTFAMQLDALKRYRSSGEPKVTVQQVFMSEGRQATLDDVTKAPCEGTPEHPTTLAPALADTRQPAMEMVRKSEAALVPAPAKQWPAIIHVIRHQCGRARAAAPGLDLVRPADRRPSPVKGAVECTAEHRVQVLRAATRTHGSMASIPVKPLQSDGSSVNCCGNLVR